MYVPAVPDVQGDKAKSKPVLLRFEPGLGWRLWGAGPSASTSLVKHGERCERWVCVCEGAWRRREIQASWPHKLSSLRG